MPLLGPGSKLSHFEILEKLGEGGMGVVYKAHDIRLNRSVALKLLPPEKVADPDRKRRFIQEAQAASKLNHPNIITIYDIESTNDADIIAMEYVAGKTLGELISRRGMPFDEVLKYAIQIADALATAHSAGIVHRDLKPGNIMVSGSGHVKVLDFGVAKLTEAFAPGEDEPTRTVHTAEGIIVGTASYMSPEQAQGKPLDARSDIFSFGAVLYEMMAGQRAFRGESPVSTLSAILHEEPKPISEIAPAVPRDLEKIIRRCLRKDPERRFQHMADVKVALRELKEDSDSGAMAEAVAIPSVRRQRTLWRALLLVALATAGFAAWLTYIRTDATENLIPIPLTSYSGMERQPSFSLDGSQIAFSWDGEKQDNFDIYVKVIGPGAPLRLTTHAGPDFSPAWSPDGRQIAFLVHSPTARLRCC